MDATLPEAVEALVRLQAARPRGTGRVTLDVDGPIAELVLDHPEARHAMTVGMMEDLGRAVLRLQAWSGAAVVVRASTPDAFCSGGHLGEVRAVLCRPTEGRAMAVAMGAILDALLALPQVTVAAVSGPAVGGGAEILTAVDHRVLGRSAWIQFKQAELGVGAGWGGIRRLVHHVRPRIALRWVSTSQRVSAEVAARAGFADVVAEDDAVEAARRFLEPVVRLPSAGVRACKRQVAVARRPDADREEDLQAFLEVWGGPTHRAALER